MLRRAIGRGMATPIRRHRRLRRRCSVLTVDVAAGRAVMVECSARDPICGVQRAEHRGEERSLSTRRMTHDGGASARVDRKLRLRACRLRAIDRDEVLLKVAAKARVGARVRRRGSRRRRGTIDRRVGVRASAGARLDHQNHKAPARERGVNLALTLVTIFTCPVRVCDHGEAFAS
eukprot:169102-Prymnesium_polylepis.2